MAGSSDKYIFKFLKNFQFSKMVILLQIPTSSYFISMAAFAMATLLKL